MNETTQRLVETLQRQIELREGVITSFKRENEVQSIVNKILRRKYKFTILIYSILLLISLGINIYQLLH